MTEVDGAVQDLIYQRMKAEEFRKVAGMVVREPAFLILTTGHVLCVSLVWLLDFSLIARTFVTLAFAWSSLLLWLAFYFLFKYDCRENFIYSMFVELSNAKDELERGKSLLEGALARVGVKANKKEGE